MEKQNTFLWKLTEAWVYKFLSFMEPKDLLPVVTKVRNYKLS